MMTEYIDKEYAHSKRVFRPLSLIICDIDRFKSINDRYGHDCGDKVLKEVGKIFSSLRDYDSVARWGGEEFIVLLPDADQDIAMKVAERLRAGVADALVTLGDAAIPVTMTLGVAQINPGESWQAALARADQALYRGKEGGRNRVMASANA
jgi:diguanylate cyclase (GGDEF)-like protein